MWQIKVRYLILRLVQDNLTCLGQRHLVFHLRNSGYNSFFFFKFNIHAFKLNLCELIPLVGSELSDLMPAVQSEQPAMDTLSSSQRVSFPDGNARYKMEFYNLEKGAEGPHESAPFDAAGPRREHGQSHSCLFYTSASTEVN